MLHYGMLHLNVDDCRNSGLKQRLDNGNFIIPVLCTCNVLYCTRLLICTDKHACMHMQVMLYDEGLARFATEPYAPPDPANLAVSTMHLTNYAVNKGSSNFVCSEAAGQVRMHAGTSSGRHAHMHLWQLLFCSLKHAHNHKQKPALPIFVLQVHAAGQSCQFLHLPDDFGRQPSLVAFLGSVSK